MKREDRRKAGFLLPEEELEKQFWLWAEDPDNKEAIRGRLFMSKEERKAAIDEILADDAHLWMADKEYIKSIGGKLGRDIYAELGIKKKPEEPEIKPEKMPEKKPSTVWPPEPPHPAAGSR